MLYVGMDISSKNGYHTAHHHRPGVHWSELPKLHAEHAHKIDPALLQRSWWRFMVWTFIIRPFVPGARPVRVSERASGSYPHGPPSTSFKFVCPQCAPRARHGTEQDRTRRDEMG